MKPVDQTKFGKPEGNCLMACVASILERPLDEMPDLHAMAHAFEHVDGSWWPDFVAACASLGMLPLYLPNGRDEWPKVAPTGYTIASGLSPRGDFLHSCVAQDGVIVHDPHFSRDGIVGDIDDFILLIPVA